jgi:peptidoglycan/LPS O-acetylase OafA/YrhL
VSSIVYHLPTATARRTETQKSLTINALMSIQTMTEYNIETSLISAIIILLFLIFSSLFKTKIESAEVAHEYKFINGLRGLAAIFVFINHAPFALKNLGITNTTFSSWGQIYPNLGSFGVQIFFCITGFLFFDKIIKSPKIDWSSFFVSRIKRVTPLYYFTMLIVFIIAVLFSTQPILTKDTLVTVAGLISFNFIDNPMKVGNISLIPLSSVTWTLVHEWRFYAVLPIIAISYSSKYRVGVLLAALTIAAIDLSTSAVVCWTYFLSGIISAAIYRLEGISKLFKFTAAITAMIVFIITCGILVPGYGYVRFILTSAFFLCITLSNPKILHYQFLNRLSDISYSIYLLHLPILFIIFKTSSLFLDLSTINKYTFWSINLLAIPFIVAISTITFVNIEQRFMQKTKSLNQTANAIQKT